MSTNAAAAAPEDVGLEPELTPMEKLHQWFFHDAPSWMVSLVFHMVILLLVGLFMGGKVIIEELGDTPLFETVKNEEVPETKIERFELQENAPLDPTELTTESLTMTELPTQQAQEAVYYDDNPTFEERGGGTMAGKDDGAGGLGFNIKATGLGPVLHGAGGAEAGKGTGTGFGRGGSGTGFGGRGQGHREAMVGRYGGTKATERAVAAALNWIARHQMRDGNWSVQHTTRCADGSCTGPGTSKADAGATAMGLLPFLAAGQTHMSKGPYQRVILNGVNWLLAHQKPNGDLSAGGPQMYSHGLCAIALCEAFGMSRDYRVGTAAQLAIKFIETGQNKDGSWRYTHGCADSDTSVFGWQMMALKSAIMAGLTVDPAKVEAARRWLAIASGGEQASNSSEGRGLFGYTGGKGHTPCMTSVGLLITQYMGAGRGDPAIVNGVGFLMKNQPGTGDRNIYYWYYATQVLHNMCGPEWDTWNRGMRRILVETQAKAGCASGSWDPHQPKDDHWGNQGGRLMMTSLGALTLEVYYRYLPLYQLDKDEEPKRVGGGEAAKPAEGPAKKAAPAKKK